MALSVGAGETPRLLGEGVLLGCQVEGCKCVSCRGLACMHACAPVAAVCHVYVYPDTATVCPVWFLTERFLKPYPHATPSTLSHPLPVLSSSS